MYNQHKTICFLPVALSGQVVNNSGRGDSLASARRTLNQTERPLQHCFHSIHLKIQDKKDAIQVNYIHQIILKIPVLRRNPPSWTILNVLDVRSKFIIKPKQIK